MFQRKTTGQALISAMPFWMLLQVVLGGHPYHNAFGHYSVTISSANDAFSPVTFNGGQTSFGPGQVLQQTVWDTRLDSNDGLWPLVDPCGI